MMAENSATSSWICTADASRVLYVSPAFREHLGSRPCRDLSAAGMDEVGCCEKGRRSPGARAPLPQDRPVEVPSTRDPGGPDSSACGGP